MLVSLSDRGQMVRHALLQNLGLLGLLGLLALSLRFACFHVPHLLPKGLHLPFQPRFLLLHCALRLKRLEPLPIALVPRFNHGLQLFALEVAPSLHLLELLREVGKHHVLGAGVCLKVRPLRLCIPQPLLVLEHELLELAYACPQHVLLPVHLSVNRVKPGFLALKLRDALLHVSPSVLPCGLLIAVPVLRILGPPRVVVHDTGEIVRLALQLGDFALQVLDPRIRVLELELAFEAQRQRAHPRLLTPGGGGRIHIPRVLDGTGIG